MFVIFCLCSLRLDICGLTVKLSFQWGAPDNGGKYTLLGSCSGGSEVCYDVTKTVFFPERLKRLFSFSLSWITIVALWKYFREIRERIKEFQSNLETRESEN